MPQLNTIVIDGVNTIVITPEGVITVMNEKLDTLADRIRFVRNKRGLSQGGLAKLAGVSQGTIGNFEGARGQDELNTKRKPSLPDIAKALNVPLEWLRDGVGSFEFGPEPISAPVNIAALPPEQSGLSRLPTRRSLDKMPFHEAPITRWPRRGEQLNSRLRVVGRITTIPGQYSDLTQVVLVGEAAMSPEIEEGEFIAIDPLVEARNGDVVIVTDRVGDFHLRRYRRVIGSDFEAWPTNPHFSTLASDRHGLSVAGVMVCHMRVRHP